MTGIVVPTEQEFAEEDSEYVASPALEDMAREIIERLPGLGAAERATILYRWKRKGGESAGREVWGKCKKASQLERHLTDADFIIWLAADYCQRFGNQRIAALLHHELRHIGLDDKGRLIIVGHEYEGFLADLEHYGAWSPGLTAMVGMAQQLRLPLPA